ncbi:hypothetical protein Scep_014614 [Stephania cephalantha]|uniref:Uncharacterized protein n=1 Tax=Stephania cephalantha TaxID=152367 RepID=A0AAP0P0J8_9MAGN
MCHGSLQDFKDLVAVKHLVATVAPFGIFLGYGSSEPTMPNGFSAVEAVLVPPYRARLAHDTNYALIWKGCSLKSEGMPWLCPSQLLERLGIALGLSRVVTKLVKPRQGNA